jgi:hypothetical protein
MPQDVGTFVTARLGMLDIAPGETLLRTSGYRSDGDGGGGLFLLAAERPPAGPAFQDSRWRWYALLREEPCVPEQFGASGDGESDDTEALRAALDFAAGGLLELRARTYRCTGPLAVPAGTWLRGRAGARIEGEAVVCADRARMEDVALSGTVAIGPGARVQLLRCSVEGADAPALQVAGEAEIEGGCYGASAAAALLLPGGTLRAARARFEGGATGLAVPPGAVADLIDCRVRAAAASGAVCGILAEGAVRVRGGRIAAEGEEGLAAAIAGAADVDPAAALDPPQPYPLALARGGTGAADAAGARAALGLGSAALRDIGTSGAAVPLAGVGAVAWASGASFGGTVSAVRFAANAQPSQTLTIRGNLMEPMIQCFGNSPASGTAAFVRYGGGAVRVALARSAGTTIGSPAALALGNGIGEFVFVGVDAAGAWRDAGWLSASVHAAPGSGFVPGQIGFTTTAPNGAQAQRATIDELGLATPGALRPGSFAVAALPSAAAHGAGALIFVADESGGPVLAFSDGNLWRRTTDRAPVS